MPAPLNERWRHGYGMTRIGGTLSGVSDFQSTRHPPPQYELP